MRITFRFEAGRLTIYVSGTRNFSGTSGNRICKRSLSLLSYEEGNPFRFFVQPAIFFLSNVSVDELKGSLKFSLAHIRTLHVHMSEVIS